jgi:hypothetical protein
MPSGRCRRPWKSRTTSRRSPHARSRPCPFSSPPRPRGAKSCGSGPSSPRSRIVAPISRLVKPVSAVTERGRRCSVALPVTDSDRSAVRRSSAAMAGSLRGSSGHARMRSEVRPMSASRPSTRASPGLSRSSSSWGRSPGAGADGDGWQGEGRQLPGAPPAAATNAAFAPMKAARSATLLNRPRTRRRGIGSSTSASIGGSASPPAMPSTTSRRRPTRPRGSTSAAPCSAKHESSSVCSRARWAVCSSPSSAAPSSHIAHAARSRSRHGRRAAMPAASSHLSGVRRSANCRSSSRSAPHAQPPLPFGSTQVSTDTGEQ